MTDEQGRMFRIHQVTDDDAGFLRDMHFEAAFWRPVDHAECVRGLARPDPLILLSGGAERATWHW